MVGAKYVPRVGEPAVAHDRRVIVRSGLTCAEILVEITHQRLVDVIESDVDVAVAIDPRLFVVETHGMADLVDQPAGGALIVHPYVLLAADHADRGKADAEVLFTHEAEPIRFTRPGRELNRSVRVPMRHGIQDALRIGDIGVNPVGYRCVRPAKASVGSQQGVPRRIGLGGAGGLHLVGLPENDVAVENRQAADHTIGDGASAKYAAPDIDFGLGGEGGAKRHPDNGDTHPHRKIITLLHDSRIPTVISDGGRSMSN